MKKEATGIGQRQLQESLKSATKQKEADEMTAGLQRWSADMAADANIVPDAVRDPDPTFPIQEPAPRTVAPPRLAKMVDGEITMTKRGEKLWEDYEALKPPKIKEMKEAGFFERLLGGIFG